MAKADPRIDAADAGEPEEGDELDRLGRFGVNAALVEEIRHRYDVDPS